MILSGLMALTLLSTPEQALRDEAAEIGRLAGMFIVCQSLGQATGDANALVAMTEDLVARAKPYGVSEQELTDIGMNVAYNFGDALAAKYPPGHRANARSELNAECQALKDTKPDLFKPFAGN